MLYHHPSKRGPQSASAKAIHLRFQASKSAGAALTARCLPACCLPAPVRTFSIVLRTCWGDLGHQQSLPKHRKLQYTQSRSFHIYTCGELGLPGRCMPACMWSMSTPGLPMDTLYRRLCRIAHHRSQGKHHHRKTPPYRCHITMRLHAICGYRHACATSRLLLNFSHTRQLSGAALQSRSGCWWLPPEQHCHLARTSKPSHIAL